MQYKVLNDARIFFRMMLGRMKFRNNFELQSAFEMNKPQEDLKEIRQMMERSSRFLSLSGSSGLGIGFLATAFVLWQVRKGEMSLLNQQDFSLLSPMWEEFILGSFGLFLICLVLSMALTIRRTLKKGLTIWTASTRNIIGAIGLPMMVGAVLILQNMNSLKTDAFIPITLLCYGLGLFFTSRYTYGELRIMGLAMMCLGTLAVLYPAMSVLFWVTGFGLLHMVYGAIMYFRYER